MDKYGTLPVLALRGKIVYPDTNTYFEVSRTKSLKALERAMNQDQIIFLAVQRDPMEDDPEEEDLYNIGTVAKIGQMAKAGTGVLRVFVDGLYRARMVNFYEEDGSLATEYELMEEEDFPEYEGEAAALFRSIKDWAKVYAEKNPGFLKIPFEDFKEEVELCRLINTIISELPYDLDRKQQILEEVSVRKQCEMLLTILMEEVDISDYRNEITQKVKQNVDKNQKEYLLREQQKVIREELGEEDLESEADEYLKACKELDAPESIKDKIEKEIKRFKVIPPMAADSFTIRNYIETMLEMPWNKATTDNNDLNHAKEILEEDHYGLEKIKERVLDYLAVRNLSGKNSATILCLAGPPGTGKTSVAKSIARALEKKYVRISLGGVRDEAEIRGHRKTYVAAMPGRIADSIRQAGVCNPLILLDEVDKASSNHKGDVAASLLEVLDAEQNVNFRDHYLEVPLDLSKVLFIATANDLSLIDKPLRDRMEIIDVSSYTENEKYHIAKNYLVKKQREASGLSEDQVSITDEAIYGMIRRYTREAGVRNLERTIGTIMHKAARNVLVNGEGIHVDLDQLETYLDVAPFDEEDSLEEPQVGIVRGLAWTSVGGDTLSIEVNTMPGKGQMKLTGRMGDVMKESAEIGLSYIRSIADSYGIEAEYFEKNDLHIHIPEGAVPKDGPSAGITMATAMLSAITGKKVRSDLAMTGEITLRGKVLPIGGLKEKLLAAKAAGIKEVLVPIKNEHNVLTLEEEITEGMTISFVSKMEEVLEKALLS
ncbi:MAG: endopeptidase La [Eubacteriales bacterium]|nr:endopeptidase La [Eubacteriales bacterium]